jgi:hypothetical protein
LNGFLCTKKREITIEEQFSMQEPKTCSARLERTSTGSWITIHARNLMLAIGRAQEAAEAWDGLTCEHWEMYLAELYPDWELVLCGDDIN